jgi:hypothetical protein
MSYDVFLSSADTFSEKYLTRKEKRKVGKSINVAVYR